ncbi:hypothetical protein MLD38_019642 [Melastoma candidum]|uniref:Uncharacterized protein n=1 Tax=Melastoma candidum TaxID=119954 RepID=A0ACB9QWS8_9MYRT|nr:hypothetical protein MLD38_019642 [Melastoma candidum]
MALRSLDNALPITPERPKKQAKVSLAPPQAPDVCPNDENKAPLPPPGDAAIDYITSENLCPIKDPDSSIHCLMEGLESKDWTKVCRSLNDARRFALFNPDLLLPHLDEVVTVVVKATKNPRSALCKTAVMAASDFFNAYGDKLLQSDTFDSMLLQLLLKSSQDKRFVCEEADKAISALVRSTSPVKLLHKLRAFVSHPNLRIRAKAAGSISACVSSMGWDRMEEFGKASLLQVAAELLNDRLPEAREAARGVAACLYECVGGEESGSDAKEAWQSFCQGSLPSAQVQSMVKIMIISTNPN